MPERLENALLKLGWRPPKRGVVVEAQDPAAPAPLDIGYGAPTIRQLRVPLGDSYQNRKYEIEGSFLWCAKTSIRGAYCRIAFNEQDAITGGLPFYEGTQISGSPFSCIWATNPCGQPASSGGASASFPYWVDLVASSIPLETKQPTADMGIPIYSASLQRISANNVTPNFLPIDNFLGTAMYGGSTPDVFPRAAPFEVWLQNDPVNSTDRMAWRVYDALQFGAARGSLVTVNDHLLDIGETVILPYIPPCIEILSVNAATAVTATCTIMFRSC